MTRAAPHKKFEQRLTALPPKPGVYIFKDERAAVIYVGKAASLRNRVRSYFGAGHSFEPKVRRLAEQIADIDFILTGNTQEALLLEATLVKRHQPFFNIRLKDDKHYPYLKIDLKEPWPRVEITRRVLDDGARYFGPFASAGSVRRTLDLVKKLFPWRSCTKTITGNDPRPCLDYYIGRCIGPCAALCTKDEYDAVIRQTIMFLEGRTDEITRQLRLEMREASQSMEYERAARLRDQVQSIERTTERQVMEVRDRTDMDVFGLARGKQEAFVQVFFVRRGNVIGRDIFQLDGTVDETDAEVLRSFLEQFYQSAPYVPARVLLPAGLEEAPLIEEWLSQKRGTKVRLLAPVRGEKRMLLRRAMDNARESLEQARARWLADSGKKQEALQQLQDELNLPSPPRRIECYDISNIQGASAVGSMVVFVDGQPRGPEYRRFRIKGVTGANDFAMMQEVLKRRFWRFRKAAEEQEARVPARPTRALRLGSGQTLGRAGETAVAGDAPPSAHAEPVEARAEGDGPTHAPVGTDLQVCPDRAKALSPQERAEKAGVAATFRSPGEGVETPAPQAAGVDESFGAVPDLVIVDGGKGQVSAAHDAMRNLGIGDIPLAGLAKRFEELYVKDVSEPIVLPRTSQALYLVQRIRDEAHRFAISYHRDVRRKRGMQSALDEIPGIGPKRKKALLRKFGSLKAVKDATVEEIASTPGFTRSVAEKVLAAL